MQDKEGALGRDYEIIEEHVIKYVLESILSFEGIALEEMICKSSSTIGRGIHPKGVRCLLSHKGKGIHP